MGEEISLHEIGPGQIFIGRVNPAEILPRDAQKLGKAGAQTQEHGVIFLQQLVHGLDPSDHTVNLDLYSQPLHIIDLCLDNVLGKTEFRNAVNQDATGLMEGLKDGHFVSFQDQVSCQGQPCRARSDDSHFFPGGRCLFRNGDASLLPFPVCGEPLQPADRDRFILFSNDAEFFALVFLGTDSAANGRKTVSLFQLSSGSRIISLRDELNKGRDIDFDRAPFNAFRLFALETAARFQSGLFRTYIQKELR